MSESSRASERRREEFALEQLAAVDSESWPAAFLTAASKEAAADDDRKGWNGPQSFNAVQDATRRLGQVAQQKISKLLSSQ